MKLQKSILPFISGAIFFSNAFAQDHLYPEPSIFSGIYAERAYSLLANRLGRMSGPNAFANAVVLPSFSRDYVVVFEIQDGKYNLICMQTKISMGLYPLLEDLKNGTFSYADPEDTKNEIERLEELLPENPIEVEAIIQEVPLSDDLGLKIYTAWGEMLYRTRFPTPKDISPESYAEFGVGQDGTMYHFNFFHRHTPLSGWYWGGPNDTLVGKLIAVTTAAKNTCDENAGIESLEQSVNEFQYALELSSP